MSWQLFNDNAANPAAPAAGKRYIFSSSVDGMTKTIDPNSNLSLFDNVKISSIVAASSGIANTDTKIGSGLYVPANNFTVGDLIRITILGTCTAAAGGAQVFTIRFGANNTVADTAIGTVSFTSQTSGTSIAFRLDIVITVRTIGASGTIYGTGTILNQGTTGIYTLTVGNFVIGNLASLVTTAAGYIGLSYISGSASVTTTFQNIITELIRQ